MANPYFDMMIDEADSDFIGDAFSDFIYDHGHGVKYLPREVLVKDTVMNEIIVSDFPEAVDIDIYFTPSTATYMGPMPTFNFMSMSFGSDSTIIHIDKRKFMTLVGRLPYKQDIIYVEEFDKMYVVVDVNQPDPFISSSTVEYTVQLSIEPYSSSEGTEKLAEDVINNGLNNDMDGGLNDILKVLNPDQELENNIDFSDTDYTMDDNPYKDNADDSYGTMDSIRYSVASRVDYIDSTVTTMDESDVTFDSSAGDDKSDENMNQLLSGVDGEMDNDSKYDNDSNPGAIKQNLFGFS